MQRAHPRAVQQTNHTGRRRARACAHSRDARARLRNRVPASAARAPAPQPVGPRAADEPKRLRLLLLGIRLLPAGPKRPAAADGTRAVLALCCAFSLVRAGVLAFCAPMPNAASDRAELLGCCRCTHAATVSRRRNSRTHRRAPGRPLGGGSLQSTHSGGDCETAGARWGGRRAQRHLAAARRPHQRAARTAGRPFFGVSSRVGPSVRATCTCARSRNPPVIVFPGGSIVGTSTCASARSC